LLPDRRGAEERNGEGLREVKIPWASWWLRTGYRTGQRNHTKRKGKYTGSNRDERIEKGGRISMGGFPGAFGNSRRQRVWSEKGKMGSYEPETAAERGRERKRNQQQKGRREG